MISTYLSYDLIARDLKTAMMRTAQQNAVQREADYFKENIGRVTSVDEFVDDYRLFSYAMKAYGLEDMTYARAFMKKVLESDLSDTNSFANKLTDKRYREFAAAFQFSEGTKEAMTGMQIDEAIGLYDLSIVNLDERISSETAYFKAMVAEVTSVDQFLADPRLRDFMYQAYGIDPAVADRTFIRNVLVSDLDDPNSFYVTQIEAERTTAQQVIDEAQPVIAALQDRQGLISERDYFLGLVEAIETLDADIAAAEAAKSEPGADLGEIENTIDGYSITRHIRFANFLDMALEDLNEQKAAMIEGGAAQAEIDAIDAKIASWTGDRTARDEIILDLNEIINLRASMTEEGADVAAIQSQIDALRTQIGTASGNLTVGLNDINEAIAAKTAAIELYGDTLPAPGEETDAFLQDLSRHYLEAETYLAQTDKYRQLAEAFHFNADGSVADGGFQNEEELQTTSELYTFRQDRLTRAGALLNDQYFRQKVNTFGSVAELMADSRIVEYLKAAFGLSTYATVVTSTLENAMTTPATDADLEDPDNYLVRFHKGRPYFDDLVALSRAFNFQEDGTLPDGAVPVDATEFDAISGNYFSRFDDADEEDDADAVRRLKLDLYALTTGSDTPTTVDDILNSNAIYSFVMKAVGLDPQTVSKRIMKKVLTSDLQDPKSFVYTLKDERYVKFASLFNFDAEGNVTAPATAQDHTMLQQTVKDYIIRKTRFLEGPEAEKAKKEAEAAGEAYQKAIAGVTSLEALLADRSLLDFAMISKGLDPATVTDAMLESMFRSDLSNPDSYVNTMDDYRYAELVASFNFAADGTLIRDDGNAITGRGELAQTMNLYLRQQIEQEQGADNAGVRLALYFERMAPTITSAYDILSDTALYEVFKTTFSLPDEISGMDIDKQAAMIEKYLDLEDLADPEKLETLVKRFTVLYDLENNQMTASPVSILMGNTSGVLSADTLMSLTQLGRY